MLANGRSLPIVAVSQACEALRKAGLRGMASFVCLVNHQRFGSHESLNLEFSGTTLIHGVQAGRELRETAACFPRFLVGADSFPEVDHTIHASNHHTSGITVERQPQDNLSPWPWSNNDQTQNTLKWLALLLLSYFRNGSTSPQTRTKYHGSVSYEVIQIAYFWQSP